MMPKWGQRRSVERSNPSATNCAAEVLQLVAVFEAGGYANQGRALQFKFHQLVADCAQVLGTGQPIPVHTVDDLSTRVADASQVSGSSRLVSSRLVEAGG